MRLSEGPSLSHQPDFNQKYHYSFGQNVSTLCWLSIAWLQAKCSTIVPQFPHHLYKSNKTSPGGINYTLVLVQEDAKESTTGTRDHQ